MMKRNVYLAQVNNRFGNNCFLPYSAGMLQAYAQSIPEIKSEYDFKGFVFLREPIADVIARMERPDVFGASCYIWNWEYSKALAKAVKEAFPSCLIVLGGPHVPVRSEGFFQEHPWADILIHYEGEATFAEVLLRRIHEEEYFRDDFGEIKGLSINAGPATIVTPPRERLSDLDRIPSPYLTGVFDGLMRLPYDFHATQETHRGCPYSCTFCDWGSNTLAKVKQFSTDRLVDEYEWMARNKIDLLYNADANYAMLPRDYELTEKMVKVKEKYGYPNKFRAAYAKNSNEKVFKVAELLNQAGMNKGITLSFQSMDDNTLNIVKRKNIKVKDFQNLIRRYRQAGIATYSELIIGLPGESYDSFADGINTLIEAGQHDSLQIYTCEVLPNSEMNHPEYRRVHEIKTARAPVLHFHATPSNDPYPEYYELVVGTKTLPEEDWMRCQLFAWAVQSFHCLGLTQAIAVFLHHYCGVSYRKFYEGLLRFAELNLGTVIGFARHAAYLSFRCLRQGQEWGFHRERFGDIIWPVEEGGFLNCIVAKERFYLELATWIQETFGMETTLLVDLISYQDAVVKAPGQSARQPLLLRHNIHEFLEECYLGNGVPLFRHDCRYHVLAKPYTDLKEFAREVVWYGRKGGTFQNLVERDWGVRQ